MKRYKPKRKQGYWFIDDTFEPCYGTRGVSKEFEYIHDARIAVGNCWKTMTKVEKVIAKLKKII